MKRICINKHYTFETRLIIENSLNEGFKITDIAKKLSRDASNIAKEINKHKQIIYPSTFNYKHPCKKHRACKLKEYECFKNCKKIDFNLCEKLKSSPHVCNACTTKRNCRYVKYYYKAEIANCEYLNQWKNDRVGLHYTEEELNVLNNDFYILVLCNKSIYHSLLIINAKGYNFNTVTVYKQIKRGQLKLKSYQLPRARKIKSKKRKDKTNKRNIEGMTYEDYTKYIEGNPNTIEWQMDTVEGIKNTNEPVLLTLQLVPIKFIFIFKLNHSKTIDVTNKLKEFKEILSVNLFNDIFNILLTDNGSEFTDTETIKSLSNNLHLFFCHPYSSCEKGSIENNHELIRRVIPKGVSLKAYNQSELNILCSHINSLYRKELNGKSPFALIDQFIPIETLYKLGLKPINPNNVILIPELLGAKNVENIKKHLSATDITKANIVFANETDVKDINKILGK